MRLSTFYGFRVLLPPTVPIGVRHDHENHGPDHQLDRIVALQERGLHRKGGKDHAHRGGGDETREVGPDYVAPEGQHRHDVGGDEEGKDGSGGGAGGENHGEEGHAHDAQGAETRLGDADEKGGQYRRDPGGGGEFGQEVVSKPGEVTYSTRTIKRCLIQGIRERI